MIPVDLTQTPAQGTNVGIVQQSIIIVTTKALSRLKERYYWIGHYNDVPTGAIPASIVSGGK